MSTSGTTAFNPDVLEILEEAFERAGIETRTGADIRTARRSLNILALEWANRGLNLWTVEPGTLALLTNTATYSLPTDTIDLMEHVVRTGTGATQTDYPIVRMSYPTYEAIPNKNSTGRPNQILVRRSLAPTIVVWPVPPDATYTLHYWRLRRIQDAGTGGENTLDIPERFIPAMISGLAFHIAMKRPEVETRVPLLKQYYEEQFELAGSEDRDRATLRLVPRL